MRSSSSTTRTRVRELCRSRLIAPAPSLSADDQRKVDPQVPRTHDDEDHTEDDLERPLPAQSRACQVAPTRLPDEPEGQEWQSEPDAERREERQLPEGVTDRQRCDEDADEERARTG